MSFSTFARTAAIVCAIAALFITAPAASAAGDDGYRVAAAGVQPARRVLKALGIGRAKRVYRGTDSLIDASSAAALDSIVLLSADIDPATERRAHAAVGEGEVWPAAPALFPDKLEAAHAPDDLR